MTEFADTTAAPSTSNSGELDTPEAGGLSVAFVTTFMASVKLAKLKPGSLELLVINCLGLEYWLLGDSPYYYNVKKDVILARSDWLFTTGGSGAGPPAQ